MDYPVLKQVAWLTDDIVRPPIRGMVVEFPWLGWTEFRTQPSAEDTFLAENGILNIIPYYGPWSWMNPSARAFVEEVLDSTRQVLDLPQDLPLVCTGVSMGGCSSLLFARYYQGRLDGCVANCPVCDLPFHFSERPDLPRTFYHAFTRDPVRLADALRTHSPRHESARMRRIPYCIIQGDADPLVSKKAHSDQLVAALRQQGHSVVYEEIPGMGHGGPMPPDLVTRIRQFLLNRFQPQGA
jgi:dipeptidyl aminopeptidase/acylaminoacyl peptidase